MRANIWILLAGGAAAFPAVPGPVVEEPRGLAALPTGAVAFKVVDESEALSKLSAKAEATPGAVRFLAGVPLSQDAHGKVHDVKPKATPNMTPAAPVQRESRREPGPPGGGPGPRPAGPGPAGPGGPGPRPGGPGPGGPGPAGPGAPQPQPTTTSSTQAQPQTTSQPQPQTTSATSTRTSSASSTKTGCAQPTMVQEWRNMSPSNQQAFSAAIKCLFGKPSRSGITGAVTRWDDLAAVHQSMTLQIHSDGVFMPWHRYFLYIFEQELRNTCGYSGPMAWWDETKDAGKFSSAPMFTSDYFGSLPDGGNQCITNGYFASTTLHIGPGSRDTNHCLARGGNEQYSSQITTSYLNTCWSYNNFNDMQKCIDYGVHALGHNAVGGGVMNDVYASPQDPTFFLHHGFVNRNWHYWQQISSGNANTITSYVTPACESGSQTSGCSLVTTSYVLSSLNFYPSITVADVMNTSGGFLCYEYDY